MANTYKQIALLIIPFVFLLLRNAADPRVCHAQQPSGEASCQEKGAQQFLTQATGTWHARTVVLGFLFARDVLGLRCHSHSTPENENNQNEKANASQRGQHWTRANVQILHSITFIKSILSEMNLLEHLSRKSRRSLGSGCG